MNSFKKSKRSTDCSGKSEVFFRKVTIPATFGDELTGIMKPENGAYNNALVFYEASGVSFLYDSDGVYTKIANIEGQDSGVISVNGKQGVVTITLAELGGMTETQINTLIASKGYQTASQVDIKIANVKAQIEREIPTVNNATLTIKRNGTTVNTFTANSSTDKTADITVPTKTTDLTNDAGYQTSAQVDTKVAAEATARAAAISAVEAEIPDVVDNVTSTSTTNALSAKQGKLLNDRITNIDSRGRYLSTWDATTGEPGTEPEVLPYVYRTGDYFIVATVGATNYRPTGAQYTGTPSTVVETETVSPNDTYLYDGTTWELIHTEVPQIAIDENLSTTSRNAVWNSTITNALGDKVDKVTGKQLSTEDYTSAEKTKLSGVETGAEVNIIETVKVNGTALTPDSSRAVNVVAATPSDLASKQDTLTAGDNIDITNNVISATDTTYTAGDNITISDNEISANVPELLTTTGQSEIAGMTQKAITDALAGAGGSGVKVLTQDDYNWPTTGTKTSVALWLLDSGVYHAANNIATRVNKGSESSDGSRLYIINKGASSSSIITMPISSSSNTMARAFTTISGDNDGGGSVYLVQSDVKNLLTSTSTNTPLSANQGKVLKDLIDSLIIKGTGAPTTATVGTVGKLYEDTTNGKLYQCTAVSGSTYTWEEVGGGGPTVVQTTGTSTTDVMSQDATTKMVYPSTTTGGIEIRLLADNISAGRSSQYGISIGSNGSTSLGTESVGIGRNFAVLGDASVCLGPNTKVITADGVQSHRSVAIGINATVSGAKGALAIGAHSKATQQGEFNIGLPDASSTIKTNYGYNGTSYRLLTGLHDPVSDHDAATKGYVDSHAGGSAAWGDITGTLSDQEDLQDALDEKQDTLTAGTGISITNNVISATGGGGGPTVVQTTGTSTTDVMSQNATTKMIFPNASSKTNISIGDSQIGGYHNIHIGAGGSGYGTYGDRAITFGNYVRSNGGEHFVALGNFIDQWLEDHDYGVGLGSYSKVTRDGEVNVGLTGDGAGHGYNSTNYRVIGGVHDGVNAHDACTKGQLDAAVGDIETAIATLTTGTGA